VREVLVAIEAAGVLLAVERTLVCEQNLQVATLTPACFSDEIEHGSARLESVSMRQDGTF
jgi:hypothetical protein